VDGGHAAGAQHPRQFIAVRKHPPKELRHGSNDSQPQSPPCEAPVSDHSRLPRPAARYPQPANQFPGELLAAIGPATGHVMHGAGRLTTASPSPGVAPLAFSGPTPRVCCSEVTAAMVAGW
jgi:hypothetical protein